jgi:hypothetical protein
MMRTVKNIAAERRRGGKTSKAIRGRSGAYIGIIGTDLFRNGSLLALSILGRLLSSRAGGLTLARPAIVRGAGGMTGGVNQRCNFELEQ